MAKKLQGPQMIIANRLTDGRVVFFTQSGGWSADLTQAAIADEGAIDTLFSQARKDEAHNTVVSVEVIEANTEGDTPAPAHMKPFMQSKGPTVRLDLGYQTGTNWEA